MAFCGKHAFKLRVSCLKAVPVGTNAVQPKAVGSASTVPESGAGFTHAFLGADSVPWLACLEGCLRQQHRAQLLPCKGTFYEERL